MMRFAGNNVLRLRAWNAAACLIAVLAMCSSAVAACACSHHQPQVKVEEEPSCHSRSHAEPTAAAQAELDASSLHTGCNCYVNDRRPAISVKSESKKFSAVKLVAGHRNIESPAPILVYSGSLSANFHSPKLHYSQSPLSSGPSRAPPRL